VTDQKLCRVSVRVWGDFACVTRPELKAERASYGILTPSAARGVLEAIFYEPQMYYLVHEIGVIKRGRWFSFRRNEVKKVISIREAARAMTEGASLAPIRAGGGAEDATQRGMLALADVEYVITAEIRLTHRAEPPRDSLEKYRGLFIRRAESGKCHHRPYLGCREFDANFTYVPDPSAVELCEKEWPGEDLGLMLYDVFDPRDRESGKSVTPNPVFFNAKVKNARLECHPERVKLVRRQVPTAEVTS
jgi:CRISPR-associated protein Cas5d